MLNTSNPTAESEDPFAPENIGVLHFIQLSRIYDTLMAILSNTAPEQAEKLLEVHYNGGLMGPTPHFSGNFITDELNNTDG